MTIQMKRIILLLLGALVVASGAYAKRMSELKIYINPGHGGYTSDDRPIRIYPFEQNDTLGYWESKSNLYKGLHMYHILDSLGATPYLSRIKNTQADDRSLSGIAAEANSLGVDLFFSIHSNATGTEARRNFPLMLYRGYDNEPVIPNSDVIAKILNKYLLQNKATYWTSTNINCRGDFSFYPTWHGAGLGVLRGNTRVSMLSEGSFHDYIPETYRLMNKDFCWMEAWHFRKAIDEYFNQPGVDFGVVAGRLNDNRTPI